MSKVLVVAAHPDDELLGCGGTMAGHVARGDEVVVAFLAEGLTARDPRRDVEKRSEEMTRLRQAARAANGVLGVGAVEFFDFPDNRLDSVDRLDLIKVVEDLLARHQPELLYTHHAGDLNVDHRRVQEAVVTACRPIQGQCSVRTMLFFEVASSTEWQVPHSLPPFCPNWFVNIESTLESKLSALKHYDGELRPFPHPRSAQAVEALARVRGAASGYHAAEGFMLGRRLQ